MKACMGNDFNEQVEEAWQIIFDIIATLVEQYKSESD